MGKYIKLFETHSEYQTYINGQDKVLPNVSYCEDNNDVHYNPWTDPRLIVKYNVEDDSNPTMLYTCISDGGMTLNGAAMFDKVELDGIDLSISDLDTAQGTYQLSEGEHTARYTLKDPTLIGVEIIDMNTQQINIGATFFQCTAISEVNIPNTVTTIAQNAFASCTSLTNVVIPNSVTTIGEVAFNNCTSLTNINIPNSVTSIGNQAFYYCTGLTSVTIPNSVTTIGQQAFEGCSSITNINIPNSVTSIGNQAFYYCTGLTSVTIGNSVTTIGQYAFTGCTGLTSVTIPDSVTNMGNYAFSSCTGLTSITIGNSITTIGTFAACTGLTSVTIGNGVTTISSYAFNGCSSLTSIISLATTAPTIYSNTFQDVKTGGTLTVPTGATGYDVWMGTGNYYLGKYSWTKVEQ